MATILLTGATGNVAGATIAALQGSGHKLVALVRDANKAAPLAAQGIELRVGDLEKPRTVEDQFGGADAVFIIVPPGHNAPYLASNALHAARRAKVKHVLRLSAVGAAHDAPTLNSRLHALSDAELTAAGIPYTIIKPHFFAQNLLAGAQTVAEQGVLYFALGNATMPQIDVRDVGASAAAILKDPGKHAGKTYTLTGPESISMEQFAGYVSDAVGKPVRYQPIPVEAAVEQFAKFGLDDYNQTALRDYFHAYSSGWQNVVTSSVKDLTGTAARSMAEFARDFAPAFGKR